MRPSFRIIWTEPAAHDLEHIVEYVASEGGVVAAASIWQRVEPRVGALTEYPSRGRLVPELRAQGLSGYREAILRPYRIVYRMHERDVMVLAVLDGRRELQQLLLERALAVD